MGAPASHGELPWGLQPPATETWVAWATATPVLTQNPVTPTEFPYWHPLFCLLSLLSLLLGLGHLKQRRKKGIRNGNKS